MGTNRTHTSAGWLSLPAFWFSLVTTLPDQILTTSSISPGSKTSSSSSYTFPTSMFSILVTKAVSFKSSNRFALKVSNSLGHSVEWKMSMPTTRVAK